MAIRIRVYPSGMGAMGAMGGYGMNGGGAVSAATYFNSRLQAQKQVGSLQLGYERALANERIERARLEERSKNPYAAFGGAGMGQFGGGFGGGFGFNPLAMGGINPLMGGLPMGGLPMGGLPMGGIPGGFPGAGGGQSNFTNQTSAGAGSQSVSNSNVLNVSHQQTMPPQFGYGGFGGYQRGSGGLISGLLGALI